MFYIRNLCNCSTSLVLSFNLCVLYVWWLILTSWVYAGNYSITWEIGMQCICKRRLISVGSSLVLIFYVTFECVATFIENFLVIGSFCILVSWSCSLNTFHSRNMLSASFLCIGWIGFLSGDFPLVKKEKRKRKRKLQLPFKKCFGCSTKVTQRMDC